MRIYIYKPLPYPSPTRRLVPLIPGWRKYTAPTDTLPEHTVTRNHHFCPVQADAGCAKTVLAAAKTVLAATKTVLAVAKTVLAVIKTVWKVAKTVFTKCQPCFFTKSAKFGRTELLFFFRVANRAIYNLSMVSGPVL